MAWTFKCSGCKESVEYASYAIAQLASGNVLIYTHSCGAKTQLEPKDLDRVAAKEKKEKK